jgi:hypothetical protein
MPLIGGGGAGNVAGGNPTGIGTSINYIGNHAYGYSGSIDVNNTETTLLEFSTGQQYMISKIQFNYVSPDSDNIQYRVYINNEVVQTFQSDHANLTHVFPDSVLNILIANESRVKLTAQNVTSSSNRPQIVSLVGRIYA